MPIIKHIPIYADPKRLLSYVTNEKKTESTLVTGLNCSTKASEVYDEMKFNFEIWAHERFFKKSIKSETAKTEKQKIRLHHYIQSFKPGEVTPQEAHRIGVEWAEKAFGKDRMILCSTHIDRGHIHNHFAVCPYDMDGKHWYANKTTLKECRRISDEIAKAHGLSIIEHPKYRPNQRYGEYKLRREGRSWKQKLCDEIDRLVLKENVKSVDDLVRELKENGYGINRGKYLAVKVNPKYKAIRTYRLGDGYSLEHLQYRIENKNMEMPLSRALEYSGIQREYALCIRQIQIQLYRRPERERLYLATYREIEKSSNLLLFLRDKKIHSCDDFQNLISETDRNIEDLKSEKDEMLQKISDYEKIVEQIPKYFEILDRKPMLAKDISELAQYNHLKDVGVKSPEDTETFKAKICDLKERVKALDEQLKEAYSQKKSAVTNLEMFEAQMKSDYQILLEQAKTELENLRREEERQRAERERSEVQEERKTQSRKKTGFSL